MEQITEKSTLLEILEKRPDVFERLMCIMFGSDWISYIRFRDGDRLADLISERLSIYHYSGV